MAQILESLGSAFGDMLGAIRLFGPMDVLDILVLAYIIYRLWKLVKETRANQLLKGILLVVVAFIVVFLLKMKAVTYLMTTVFNNGLILICIIFQPELRRALEKVGHANVRSFGGLFGGSPAVSELTLKWERAIDVIAQSCEELSATTTGALIVIERQVRLGEQIDTGTILNALPSVELFGNIFYPKTPLHDGAVIMRDGMILAGACFLPKPQKEELINKQLGSRHRAAIGMSENSDAIILIVSEETGTISVAEDGELTRGYTRESLKKMLASKLIPEKTENKKVWRLPLRRDKKK